uniref:histidine-type phosphatase n=1 Tax=Nevskia ramosa TaxID=64002 RepID=UPI00235203ED
GELTERGISLLTTLGGYYRQSYAAAGLLPEKGCPEAGTVAAWADNVVRRVPLSAQALLDGMFPGCGLQTGFAPQDKGPDPLFNPVEVGLCKLSVPKASAAILKAARGSLDQAARSERASLKAMQDILQVRSGTRCVNDAPSCGIEDFGNVLEGGKTGVTIEGGLKSATTVGENFLLQYIQGFPEKDVAWGDAATPETLSPLLGPRNLYLRLSRQPPYIAARNGSPLARALLAALRWMMFPRQAMQARHRARHRAPAASPRSWAAIRIWRRSPACSACSGRCRISRTSSRWAAPWPSSA